MKIVTFCCQKSVHVYYKGCGVTPAYPCRFHSTIERAINHLKKRGVKNPKIIENK